MIRYLIAVLISAALCVLPCEGRLLLINNYGNGGAPPAVPPGPITVVQTVSANSGAAIAGSITVTIASSTAGNFLFVGTLMSNATQVLTPSTTGTAQTFASVGTSNPGGNGQLACWYVQNCAAGTTAVTITRATGTGSWSAVVYEVSGLSVSSALDRTASSFSQTVSPVSTGTTATTTAAAEFWVALCGQFGPATGAQPAFSPPGGSWIGAGTNSSTLANPNNNSAIGYAHQIVASTGTAAATMAVSATFSAGGFGFAVTFK